MKIAILRNRITKYIHEFEEKVDRLITMQEFIDLLPEIYRRLTWDDMNPLGDLTEEEFFLASQLGYKYANTAKPLRSMLIQQEYDAMGGKK